MYGSVWPAGAYVLDRRDLRLAPPPPHSASAIGIAIGLLFTIASVYASSLMLRAAQSPTKATHPDQRGLRNVMIVLFLALIPLFIAI